MAEQRVAPLTIEEKLATLSSTYVEPRIFRVHDQLRKENEEAYEPTTVAIGPYHRGKNNLKAMEEQKIRYLQQVIHLNIYESGIDEYVMAMRNLEEEARKCYAEPVDLSPDEFVEMMLLDGCFIVQFARHHMFEHVKDDPLLRYSHTHKNISLDLMLLENQLPFFVVKRLFDMTRTSNQDNSIVNLVVTVFNDLSQPNSKVLEDPRTPGDHVDHILGIMHEIWCSSFAEVVSQRRKESRNEKWEFIKCTTQLREAGVNLKASSQLGTSLLNITFENGVIEIPPFTIKDNTERLLRNLIAYEQYRPSTLPKYVTDYVVVMDYLINSEKDVEILRHKGIIKSWLGDDETVSIMFNKLCTKVWISKNFCYAEVFNRLNRHCRKRRNIWLANLRRNYFSSPWSIISFIVAVVLLLLTLTQTIFSILSYRK